MVNAISTAFYLLHRLCTAASNRDITWTKPKYQHPVGLALIWNQSDCCWSEFKRVVLCNCTQLPLAFNNFIKRKKHAYKQEVSFWMFLTSYVANAKNKQSQVFGGKCLAAGGARHGRPAEQIDNIYLACFIHRTDSCKLASACCSDNRRKHAL